MNFYLTNFAFLLGLLCLSHALTPTTFVNEADIARFKKTLTSAFPLTDDLVSGYYAVLGYTLLKEKLPEDPCKFFTSKMDKTKLDTIFYASSGSKLVSTCKMQSTGLQQVLDAAIRDDASLQDIYYSVTSLKNLNLKIDAAKITKAVTAILKRDDSVLNLGYAFHVASALPGDKQQFFERIEDAIVQADEVDNKFLHFEGGLGFTATIMSGIYKLAEVVKKAPVISNEQALKFVNYFLSRKYVQTVKGSAQVLEMMTTYTTNKFHIPIAVTLDNKIALSPSNSDIQLRITNMLGAAVAPLTVTMENAKRAGTDAVAISKKSFQPVKGNNALYTYNFFENKPLHGFYILTISASAGKGTVNLIGNTAAQVTVKVMTEVAVQEAEIGTAYIDQVSASKVTRLTYPQTNVDLDADYHQRLYLKFKLVDKSTKAVIHAHQSFLQFVNTDTGKEVAFVVPTDDSGVYKLDLDINNKRKDFFEASGTYEVFLDIGDPVLTNSFRWKLGKVSLTFAASTTPEKPAENVYEPQPEIKHLFREKEKTPPSAVSNTFSVLCIIPLFVLFIMWLKLGVNFSNAPFSIYVPLFHLGLVSIFLLFVCFWVHLNMFDTLKWLSGLGVFTFITGHKLLSILANSK